MRHFFFFHDHSSSSSRSAFLKQHKKWCLFIFILFILIIYYFFLVKGRHHVNKPVTNVVAETVLKKEVPIYLSELGNVVATYTVTLKTQVNGLLMKVLYKEGQKVKKGQLLAEIDQRLLLAQLNQYEGQLIRDQALLDNALIDLKRYQTLWKQDSISEQTLATQIALVKQYQGTVDLDKGLIESTRVNLIYCHITSPVDGRIGLRLVDPGNFVQTTDTTGIAVITTLNPITVIFSLPEDNIPDLLPAVYAHKKVSVEAYDRMQQTLLATGQLITIDNLINTTTGTVNLRATFDNQENTLFPNQFVNIKILVKTLHNATVVATAAVQHGRNGDYVYRINLDSTVSVQKVTAGVTSGDITVISKGLMPGQKVVVEGVDKLTDGAKVNII